MCKESLKINKQRHLKYAEIMNKPSQIRYKRNKNGFKKPIRAGHQWLTPIIPATQEAEIRRIVVQSQPGQIVP
jgi:hypothetical protein